MADLVDELDLPICPHCGVNTPSVRLQGAFVTTVGAVCRKHRVWGTFACSRCGGVVVASSNKEGGDIDQIFPASRQVSVDIPLPARKFLQQSMASLHVPEGAIMLAASAVDAMLKAKNYVDGSLYNRIDSAVTGGLITKGMSDWAHAIRLDANEQRHVDASAGDASEDDALRCLDFGLALGEFLFVLPARVERGLNPSTETEGKQPVSGNPPNPKPAA